jgi:hypothetical protein
MYGKNMVNRFYRFIQISFLLKSADYFGFVGVLHSVFYSQYQRPESRDAMHCVSTLA